MKRATTKAAAPKPTAAKRAAAKPAAKRAASKPAAKRAASKPAAKRSAPKSGPPKPAAPKSASAKRSASQKPTLSKPGGSAPGFPYFAIIEGRTKDVRAYLAAGGDINAVPKGAMGSLLEDAVGVANLKLVKELLGKGADPNVLGVTKSSPLQKASELGLDEIVDVLLKHGADATYRDPRGQTALHLAGLSERLPSSGPVSSLPLPKKGRVIRLLLDAGADPRIKDNAARTARFFVQSSSNHEGLELLPEDPPETGTALAVPSDVGSGNEAKATRLPSKRDEARTLRGILSRTVRALEASGGDRQALSTSIHHYLEEGDAFGCSPSELWDHFATSTPSLVERAGLDRRSASLTLRLFEAATKARYRPVSR
ncbi:MAG: ankyrin repeat domain-containing protein [Polyangiaceae bacterium]